MGRDDWFRRTTWSSDDQAQFQARLKRSRGSFHKAQYLRIQAFHLAEVGKHRAAIELLDQLFTECPERGEMAAAHSLYAESLLASGDETGALDAYRKCFEAQRKYPNARTNGALEFAFHVARRGLASLYSEAERALDEFHPEGRHTFPFERFMAWAARAIIAASKGEAETSSRFARSALAASRETFSGFSRHPTIGLVSTPDEVIVAKLAAISGSG
jgi:tetratricopeptide (TPR) repeat protein